jgi:hypothetical protein
MNNGVATTTMDSIVRTVLMELNLPIHFYFRAATIGIRTMRDINLGTLPYVKTARLTVDAFNECNIPADLVDWIKVGTEKGAEIVPMGENRSYNRLPKLDDADAQIAYNEPAGHTVSINSSFNNYTFGRSINDYGEITGKMFGLGGGTRADEFKFFAERGKILVGGNLTDGDTIYIEYVAYDTSQFHTGIPIVATPFIEQSIKFNFARYDRTGRLGDINREQQILSLEKRKLRSALTSIDTDTMLRLFRSNYKQSIKA